MIDIIKKLRKQLRYITYGQGDNKFCYSYVLDEDLDSAHKAFIEKVHDERALKLLENGPNND